MQLQDRGVRMMETGEAPDRRAFMGLAGKFAAGGMAASLVGCATSKDPTADLAPSGRAVMIVGKGIWITNWDEYQADLANSALEVKTNVNRPIDGITYRFRRYDPDSTLVAPLRGHSRDALTEVAIGQGLADPFTNAFHKGRAVLNGIATLGLSAVLPDSIQDIEYKAFGIESGHWTWERTVTSKISGNVNNITHRMHTRENRVGEKAPSVEIREGEVVYIGDVLFEGTLQRGHSGNEVVYTTGKWGYRLAFEPDRMARLYGNDSKFSGQIIPRQLS